MIKVGTDIIEVQRIEESIAKYGDKFLRKIYTESEIIYCQKYKLSAERFAGKFAAKEATQKALMGAYPGLSFPLKNIEIRNNVHGKPEILLLRGLTKFTNKIDLEVSISHIKKFATATTILVEK